MITRIAHISDLHFGAAEPRIVAALLDDLNTWTPGLVAISGDLTMGARRTEFRAAQAFIRALQAPTLTVPGNHDLSPYHLWQRFTDPYKRWRVFIAPDQEPMWTDNRVAVFGLNTARRAGWSLDWSRGRVTHARLHRLLDRLRATPPGLTRIVVAHHPLLPPEDSPKTPVAGGAVAALKALEAAQVRLILAGHLHRGYSRLASAGGTAPLILQGATATSTRLRGEPNAYNRITVDSNDRITVETRIWFGNAWTARPAAKAPVQALEPLTTGRHSL